MNYLPNYYCSAVLGLACFAFCLCTLETLWPVKSFFAALESFVSSEFVLFDFEIDFRHALHSALVSKTL